MADVIEVLDAPIIEELGQADGANAAAINAVFEEEVRREQERVAARAAAREAGRVAVREAVRAERAAIIEQNQLAQQFQDIQILPNRRIAVPEIKEANPDRGLRLAVHDGKVRLIRSDVMSEMSFESFAKTFLHSNPPQFEELLPADTRLIRAYGDEVRFLIELEPSVQTIAIFGQKRKYQLAMPWQYFYFVFKRVSKPNALGILWTFSDSRVFWARNRIKLLADGSSSSQLHWRDVNDLAIPARLPNIDHRTGKICFGNTAPDSTQTLAERIEAVINDFFSPDSGFNQDLGWNFPIQYESFAAWARASRLDPMCFLKWGDYGNERAVPLGSFFPVTQVTKQMTPNWLYDAVRQTGGASF